MRDDMTVLVQRIHPRADDFEIFEFFSQAGPVKDIRLIRDQRSGKSKGVGYVEFGDVESVMKALALNGIAFKGQPLLVQASMAEKNRLAQAAKNVAAANAMMGGNAPPEPTKLMVSDLHPHIAGSDLREVFSPFGELVDVQMADTGAAGASLGIAYVTFVSPSDARDAQLAINGLELAGKNIVVQFVQEAPPAMSAMSAMAAVPPGLLGGLGLGAIAGGMGALPNVGCMQGVGAMPAVPGLGAPAMPAAPLVPPSSCVLLKNMFDPDGEDERNDKDFFVDLRDDVKQECGKHGPVVDAKIDPSSKGFVYLMFDGVDGATRCVGALNNRWFAGKQITAEFFPEENFAALSF